MVLTWMTWLALAVTTVAALTLWTALARCRLASFEPTTGMRSRRSGPGAHAEVVDALLGLPGVRLLERSGGDVLLSVLPAPAAKGSLDRGWGLFVVVRPVGEEVW